MKHTTAPQTAEEDKEWFNLWFDSPYYHILYKHRDYTDAKLFLDHLIGYLDIRSEHKLLDLACGRGRHAVYLNQKGLEVVGLDLSAENVAYANRFANARLRFYEHDMRDVFAECCFNFILNLFTSFGYFKDREDDIRVIRAAAKNLAPGGKLLIDFLNPVKAINEMVSHENKQIEGITFHISKTVENGFIYKMIEFKDQGKFFNFQEKVKAIEYPTFLQYFETAGLQMEQVFGNYQLEAYDENTSDRMIFVLSR